MNKLKRLGLVLLGATIAGSMIAGVAYARIYNPSATGITSLGGLTGTTQTFANDTNVTITSSGTTHTLGWTSSLATSRGGMGTTTWLTNSVPYFNGTRMTESTSLTYSGTILTAAQLAFTNATGTSIHTSASSTIQDLNSTTAAVGTLTLTNALGRAYGGTGTTTWVTGDIAFADGTKLTSDPTNFYWDDTNNRLGLGGTTTPQRTLSVNGPIVSAECNLTDGATITINLASCNQGRVVLGGNRTIDFTNQDQALGQGIRIVICQDGTGSRTLTHDAAVRWAGGTAPTLTTTANKCDVLAGFTTAATGTPVILLDKVLNF